MPKTPLDNLKEHRIQLDLNEDRMFTYRDGRGEHPQHDIQEYDESNEEQNAQQEIMLFPKRGAALYVPHK